MRLDLRPPRLDLPPLCWRLAGIVSPRLLLRLCLRLFLFPPSCFGIVVGAPVADDGSIFLYIVIRQKVRTHQFFTTDKSYFMHSNSAEGRIMIYKSQIERLKGFTPFRTQSAQRGKDAFGIRLLRLRRLPPFLLITAPEGGVLKVQRFKIA